ncbi:MAG TPA: TlpA disulfide reductase family protein [Kofleriaceae bacterium]|nr:TlpA disulfide reductase family protein [Kofleriaceae bacterium]
MGNGLRWATAAALMVAAATAGCGGGAAARRPAPALVLPALDGGDIDLRRYRGRVVVLHFFATWAMDAETDIDQLTAARAGHGDELVVIGVAFDPDGHRVVAPWRSARKVSYLVALASDDLRGGHTGFGGIGVPTTVVIDREGMVVARVDGPLPAGRLDRLLADAGLTTNRAGPR